jgi:hypothetical protein
MRGGLRRFGVLAGAVLPCVFGCTMGPSTEQGNPQIVAVVVDNQKNPVSGATVIVYALDENRDSTQLPTSPQKVAVASTDPAGSCFFDSLPPGAYSLKAIGSDSTQAAVAADIAVVTVHPVHPAFSDTLMLNPTGALHGVVTRGGVIGTSQNGNLRDGNIVVKIREIDRFTITGPDGRYSFKGLPPGVFALYFYASDGFYTSKREGIRVRSGGDTLIDTVTLSAVPRLVPPAGLRALYDTVAATVSLTWHKVNYPDLQFYQVERIDRNGPYGATLKTTDTSIVDSIGAVPAGDTLNYVICSFDKAFNRSLNAGPAVVVKR